MTTDTGAERMSEHTPNTEETIERLIDDARGWAASREGWNHCEFVLGNQVADALEAQAERLRTAEERARTVEAERDAALLVIAERDRTDAYWREINIREARKKYFPNEAALSVPVVEDTTPTSTHGEER